MRFIDILETKMKYILLTILTAISNIGFGQHHYVSTTDTTNVIRIDTFDSGIHGYHISYSFEDSLADGTWHLLYGEDSSQSTIICTFKNQKRNGIYRAYDRDGDVDENGFPINDSLVLTMDAYYINDTLVHVIYYYYRKIYMECLENKLGDLIEVVSMKDFERVTKKECTCRSMKDGEWYYASRKRKRCFLKRLKNEQHQWSDALSDEKI